MKKITYLFMLGVILLFLFSGCHKEFSMPEQYTDVGTESVFKTDILPVNIPENIIGEKINTSSIDLPNIEASVSNMQLLDTSPLYFTEVLGLRKRYPYSLPAIVGFQYPYIYYERMTVITESASPDDADIYIGRYSVTTEEIQEFAIKKFTAISDEARLLVDEDRIIYMYCSLDEQGNMIMRIELFDFDNNIQKLLSTYSVHNVFGYAKQMSENEVVFLIYETVSSGVQQILLHYDLTTEVLSEIYRGENMLGYHEASTSTKDIWAIDTAGSNIYLLMQQFVDTQMEFYLRVIDGLGNIIQETKLDALSMYNSIEDTADSLIVRGDYILVHYSQYNKSEDNTNAPFTILYKDNTGYSLLEIEDTVTLKNLCGGQFSDTPYLFYNTYEGKEKIFTFNTNTGERFLLTIVGEEIRDSAVDSRGNVLIVTRAEDRTNWYLLTSEHYMNR